MAPSARWFVGAGLQREPVVRSMLFAGLIVGGAAAHAQTPMAPATPAPVADGCAALPIGGTGSVAGRNGTLAVAGTEYRRELRLDGRLAQRLGRDVASATIAGACRTAATDLYLIRLASARAVCPIRYHVAEVGAGGALRLGPRFGSCVDGATAALGPAGLVVTMAAGPASPASVSYAYSGGRMAAVPPPVAVAAATPPPVRRGRRQNDLARWSPPPACAVIAGNAAFRSEAFAGDALLARFQRDWPVEWRSRGTLAHQPFSRTAMRAVVSDLACLAALPGGERLVTRAARPMFESRRHGVIAFEELDEVARGTGVHPGVRAAARTFHAEMRFAVDDPRWR